MTTHAKIDLNNEFYIGPDTRLGHVHYTVADLERQIQFYEIVLGFKLHCPKGHQPVWEQGNMICCA